MHNTLLFAPVSITTGTGDKIEVSSLSKMKDFLDGWPPSRRQLFYGAAVRACEAARSGQCSPKAAREVFVAFAQDAGILWREEPRFIVVKPSPTGTAVLQFKARSERSASQQRVRVLMDSPADTMHNPFITEARQLGADLAETRERMRVLTKELAESRRGQNSQRLDSDRSHPPIRHRLKTASPSANWSWPL